MDGGAGLRDATSVLRGVLAASVFVLLACSSPPHGEVRASALDGAGTACAGPKLECPERQVCANLSGYLGAGRDRVCVWGKAPCDAVECDAFKSCTNLTIMPGEPSCE